MSKSDTDIVEVVAGLAYRKNLVLLNQRHPDTAVPLWSERWSFAGGKVEKGESREDALTREWREECDCDIEVEHLLHTMIYRTAGYSRPYRVCTYQISLRTDPHLTVAGGQSMRWVPIPDVAALNPLPGTMPALNAFLALRGTS